MFPQLVGAVGAMSYQQRFGLWAVRVAGLLGVAGGVESAAEGPSSLQGPWKARLQTHN